MTVKADTVIPDTFECRTVDSIRGYPRVYVTAELVIVGKVMNARIENIDKGEIERRLAFAVCENVTLNGAPKKDGEQ